MLQLIQTLYVCICGSGFTFKIVWSAPFLALCLEYSQSRQSGQFNGNHKRMVIGRLGIVQLPPYQGEESRRNEDEVGVVRSKIFVYRTKRCFEFYVCVLGMSLSHS